MQIHFCLYLYLFVYIIYKMQQKGILSISCFSPPHSVQFRPISFSIHTYTCTYRKRKKIHYIGIPQCTEHNALHSFLQIHPFLPTSILPNSFCIYIHTYVCTWTVLSQNIHTLVFHSPFHVFHLFHSLLLSTLCMSKYAST